jgi:hypothetical protein
MKRQLLCTFAVKDSLNLTVDYIQTFFSIENNKIFQYSESENPNQILLVYNSEKNLRDTLAKNTILVHRKKNTNTIYTINALNTLISEMNNGVLDKSYQIDWENYSDVLMLTREDKLVFTDITFNRVINI